MKVFDDALKIFATGLFVSLSAGVDLQLAIAVCGAVMVAYTFLGGLWALVVTDYVQFLMKALAILLLLPMAVIGGGRPRAGFLQPAARLLPADRRAVRLGLHRRLHRHHDRELQRELVAGAEILFGARRARGIEGGLVRRRAEPGGGAAHDPARGDRPQPAAGPRGAGPHRRCLRAAGAAPAAGGHDRDHHGGHVLRHHGDGQRRFQRHCQRAYEGRLPTPDAARRLGAAVAAGGPVDHARAGRAHHAAEPVDRAGAPAIAVQHHGDGAGAVHGAHVSAAAGGALGAAADLAGSFGRLRGRASPQAAPCWR